MHDTYYIYLLIHLEIVHSHGKYVAYTDTCSHKYYATLLDMLLGQNLPGIRFRGKPQTQS